MASRAPSPVVPEAVARQQYALGAVPSAVLPRTVVEGSVRPAKDAVAVGDVVAKFPLVAGAVRKYIRPPPVAQALPHLALVAPVLPEVSPPVRRVIAIGALPVHLPLLPRPLVQDARSIGRQEFALPVLPVPPPVSLVEGIVVVEAPSPPLPFAVQHLALVHDALDVEGRRSAFFVVAPRRRGGRLVAPRVGLFFRSS